MFWLRVDLVESRLQKAILKSATAQAASSRAATSLQRRADEHEQEVGHTIRRLGDRLDRNHGDICLWAGQMGQTKYDQSDVKAELAHLAEERRRLEGELLDTRREAKRRKSRKTKCQAAAVLATNATKLWDRVTTAERRELVSHPAESITCEPTATGVTVHIAFIAGDAAGIHLCVRARAPQKCGNLEVMGPSLLTTAYHLLHGFGAKEIARTRAIAVGTMHSQKSALRRLACAKSVDQALSVLDPVLSARMDELPFGNRKPA